MDNWHAVKYDKCNCEICNPPQWFCPICGLDCENWQEFDKHFQGCEEQKKEKEK